MASRVQDYIEDQARKEFIIILERDVMLSAVPVEQSEIDKSLRRSSLWAYRYVV